MKLDDALNLLRAGALDAKLDEKIKVAINRDALETVLSAYDSRCTRITELEKQRTALREELNATQNEACSRSGPVLHESPRNLTPGAAGM